MAVASHNAAAGWDRDLAVRPGALFLPAEGAPGRCFDSPQAAGGRPATAGQPGAYRQERAVLQALHEGTWQEAAA
jgi:hypothetical protein